LFVFINKFRQIYDKEKVKLPYHINLIDELHANENAHSRILEKLLKQKTHEGKFELLESFIEYLKEKGKENEDFSKIKIKEPKITMALHGLFLNSRIAQTIANMCLFTTAVQMPQFSSAASMQFVSTNRRPQT
jgi:predicted PP-loop superfamily ATPase